jgi:hypothetical protein
MSIRGRIQSDVADAQAREPGWAKTYRAQVMRAKREKANAVEEAARWIEEVKRRKRAATAGRGPEDEA